MYTELTTCPWLVERASGNPEPDSYEDTVKVEECGAAMLPGGEDRKPYPQCEAGHTFPSYQTWAEAPEFLHERNTY